MKGSKKDSKDALKHISAYLSSSENIITNIYQTEYFTDYPFFYQYVSEYIARNGNDTADLLANGISLEKNDAIIKSVMETIERWYLSNYSERDLLFDNVNNLHKKDMRFIDPQTFTLVSQKQLGNKKYQNFIWDKSSNFYWVSVNNLLDNLPYLIPAQLVYFMYKKAHKEPIIRLSDSTGAAAGLSLEQALYNAICELVERDAYAIVYYNKLPVKKINISTIKNKETQFLIDYILRYRFSLFLFNITLDINIPVYLCVLIDDTDNGPKLSVGVKCSIVEEDAVYGAIMEAMQGINASRVLMNLKLALTKKEFTLLSKGIQPILERVLFWTKPDVIKHLRFLFDPSDQEYNIPLQDNVDEYTYTNLLEMVSQRLRDVGIHEIYWKRTTPVSLEKYHIYGVKVVAPGLQSIPLDASYAYLSGDRLYSVPISCGFQKKANLENSLNMIPHPLP